MKMKSLRFLMAATVLILLSACSPAAIQTPSAISSQPAPSAEPTNVPAVTPTPSAIPSQPTPSAELNNTPTVTPMPTNTPQSPVIALPPSARLGALLSGSGTVQRTLLTYDDLMNGLSSSPLDDSAFALPEEAAMPAFIFEGRLELSAGAESSGFQAIRDDQNYSAVPGRRELPAFDLEFVQDGSYLIPVRQGLIFTGHPYWNYIIGPGRIWQENGDNGYARASFPFALVERNQNCTHNGVMTFLFNGASLSPVRYQITQETCLYFKFNMWGQVTPSFTPGSIPNAAALKAEHAAEVANRLPTKPIASLATDFPDSKVNLARFSSGITPEDMTAYGLVINGVNYVSDCQTRYGQYAYCEGMRLPSYSTAKSAFASIALMRLGQKYGGGVYDLLIKDYVPEAASSTGDWTGVTFKNTIDMATGNYELSGFEADESGPTMIAFLDEAESYTDKIKAAFNFPRRNAPGKVWIYHTSDIFILTRAMNNYLVQQEGGGADIFNMLRDEVYLPLHLSAGALTSLRTDNSPTGVPFGGYGLFWTQDDIAKIGMLLNEQSGAINGVQVLNPDMLADALQQNPDRRGLNTTGVPVFKYSNAFWAREWSPSVARQYSCTFWTPFMSGYGGISVVLMPNGSIFYYFSDNAEFSWYDAVNESNKLIPMCR